MGERKPVLVVVAGPNGSGKTAITSDLRKAYDWTDGLLQINPDQIAQEEFGDWNNPSSILQAAKKADQIREECLAEGKGLLFETVLSTPEKVDYIRRAKEAGYFIRLVYVATESPEINMLRVEWRFSQGGHTVPREKIEPRYIRSLKLAVDAARLADRAYFVDNSRDVDEEGGGIAPFAVFRTIDGVVAKSYLPEAEFPEWTKPIYNALK